MVGFNHHYNSFQFCFIWLGAFQRINSMFIGFDHHESPFIDGRNLHGNPWRGRGWTDAPVQHPPWSPPRRRSSSRAPRPMGFHGLSEETWRSVRNDGSNMFFGGKSDSKWSDPFLKNDGSNALMDQTWARPRTCGCSSPCWCTPMRRQPKSEMGQWMWFHHEKLGLNHWTMDLGASYLAKLVYN